MSYPSSKMIINKLNQISYSLLAFSSNGKLSNTVAHTHFYGFEPKLGGNVLYFASQQAFDHIIKCLQSTIRFVMKTLFLSMNRGSL